MKRITQICLFVLGSLTLLTNCLKENDAETVEIFDVSGKEVLTTNSGLKYITVVEGTGASPQNLSEVVYHYNLYLDNGKFEVISSSQYLGSPLVEMLGINRCLKGLDEGLRRMKAGGKTRFIIPAELAYGAQSAGSIPANSSLVMDITLVSFVTDTRYVSEVEKLKHYADSAGISDKITSSGMYYIEQQAGTGGKVGATDIVSIKYTLYDMKGTILETNVDKTSKLTFTLGNNQVITGMEEGVAMANYGTKARLIIPSYLAYGKTGVGSILPFQSLVFDVEVFKSK